jgi:hypothetical protein
VKLIADSKDFSHDRRAVSFAILIISSIPFMFAPLYVLVWRSSLGVPLEAALAELLGGITLMLFLGLFLMGKGILFKVPLRAFDEGVLIQPAVGLRPALVPYADISAIELFYGADGSVRTGCVVSAPKRGRIRSIENFHSPSAVESFVAAIRPALEQAGFRLADRHVGNRLARFEFRRHVLPPRQA